MAPAFGAIQRSSGQMERSSSWGRRFRLPFPSKYAGLSPRRPGRNPRHHSDPPVRRDSMERYTY